MQCTLSPSVLTCRSQACYAPLRVTSSENVHCIWIALFYTIKISDIETTVIVKLFHQAGMHRLSYFLRNKL